MNDEPSRRSPLVSEAMRPLARRSSQALPTPATSAPPPGISIALAWLSELRRRWLLATLAGILVAVPVWGYALVAVPTYTAKGALQVSAASASPVLDFIGAGGRSPVETEVEVLRGREFVLGVLHELRLHVVDPHQSSVITTDPAIALGRRSPETPTLAAVREAIDQAVVAPDVFRRVAVRLRASDESRLQVEVGAEEDRRAYDLGVGETLEDAEVTMGFSAMPLVVGESIELELLGDGELLERSMRELRVASVGSAREPTNIVQIEFTHSDRDLARGVVDTMMRRYLEQSLRWQALSASTAASFISQRLQDAKAKLHRDENALREFAEAERAIQLDAQAKATIESSAQLEAERVRVELQEHVVAGVMGAMEKHSGGGAGLTTGLFEDPVLTASVASLTEAETRLAVLEATHTDAHPEVERVAEQVKLQRREVHRLLKNAKKSLASRRHELDKQLESAMGSLSAYPDKELQLARHVRNVEVDQRLYSLLLEKHQEAEILEASTTTDKRIVDPAALPYRSTAPVRPRLIAGGLLGGLAFALCVVYLAQALQRRLATVEAVREAVPLPIYGSIPAIVTKGKANGRAPLDPAASLWPKASAPAMEAYRALAVSVSLTAGVSGRGKIVSVTSSQPAEGKSTVLANLAIGLANAGHRVLVVDLDLRKPTQHRLWKARRSPGYVDFASRGADVADFTDFVQTPTDRGVDVLTAGSRLPDTLGVLMTPRLAAMLAQIATRYEYVLVDAPPAFVADAGVVARLADLLLVVVRPGVADRGGVRQMLDVVARAEVPSGLVINGIERRHADDYYGGDYYGRVYAGEEQAA